MMTTWKEAVRCPSQSTDQHTECEMAPLEITAVRIAIKKLLWGYTGFVSPVDVCPPILVCFLLFSG